MGGYNHIDDSNCGCAQCQADDDAYEDETTDCECCEYEYIDPLLGSATCTRCGSRRYLTSEQIAEIARLDAEYQDMLDRENS